MTDSELKAVLEALIYVAEEPITEANLLELFGKENRDQIRRELASLIAEYQSPERGLEIKEVANGYRLGTKAEHHEWVRNYVKIQTPPMRLSLAALETLAVIAYRQPITLPEIQDVRGVNATGVVKTLIDRKLVTTAGRKNVVGRPILYKTTKEFLLHFGLKNINELPSLEEFEELAKSEFGGEASEGVVEGALESGAAAIPGAAEAETPIPLGLEAEISMVISSAEEPSSPLETIAQNLETAAGPVISVGSIEEVSQTYTSTEIENRPIPESTFPADERGDVPLDDCDSLDEQKLTAVSEEDSIGPEGSHAQDEARMKKETTGETKFSADNEEMVPVEPEE
jgi:segregation and condensation protein B